MRIQLSLTIILCFSVGLHSCMDNDSSKSDTHMNTFAGSTQDGLGGPFSEAIMLAAGEVLGIFMDSDENTGGSFENATLLASNEAYMGLIQEDTFRYARDKYLEQYIKDPEHAQRTNLQIASQLKALMAVYEKQVFLLINTDRIEDNYLEEPMITGESEQYSLPDLLLSNTSLSINVGTVDSETYITAQAIINAHTFTAPPTLTTHTAEDGINDVINGHADAAFLVAKHPSQLLLQIPEDAPVTLVQTYMPDHRKYYMENGIIDEDQYPFFDGYIDNNMTVKMLLVGGPLLGERNLQTFIDYILNNTQEFQTYDESWLEVSQNMTEEFLLMNPQNCHPQAIAYITGIEPLDPLFLKSYFCSAENTGPYHDMAVELIYLLSHNLDVDLKEKNTTGSFENAYWLQKGDATMALLQDDLYEYLIKQGDLDSVIKVASMQKIAPLHYEYVHFIVNQDNFSQWGLSSQPFTNDVMYSFSVRTVDTFGTISDSVYVHATPHDPYTSGQVVDFAVTAGDGQIAVNWEDPYDANYAFTRIYYGSTLFASGPFTGDISNNSAVIDGLQNDIEHSVTAITYDAATDAIAHTTVYITPKAANATVATNLGVVVKNGHVELSWTNPPSNTFHYAEVHYGTDRETNTKFTGHVSSDGTRVFPNNYMNHIRQILRDPDTAALSPTLRINVGPKTSGTFITAMQIIQSYAGIDSDKNGVSDLDGMEIYYSFDAPSDALLKVASGEYDAAFVTAGVPYHRLYAHDTYSLPTNLKVLSAQFYDANGDGNFENDMPEPYRGGIIAGGGLAQFENYPYAQEVLPFDIPTVRTRALVSASYIFDDTDIDEFIKAIFRKASYQVTPSDTTDPNFMPDPLWTAINLNSFSAQESEYYTYGEDITGAMEYFVRNPFGWSPQATEYYLSLFPSDQE